MKNGQIRVMFPINQMGVGGAEQQLLELVRGIDKDHFKPIVVSLYPDGVLEPEVKAIPGVEYICLHRKSKYDFSILVDIFRLIKEKDVQIIQPFLTPASFFGLIPALMRRNLIKVVTERCGVRVNPRLGSALYRRVEDFFTRYADWVIPNSKAGETYVIDRGIDRSRVIVIYNGINLRRLNPNQEVVAEIRQRMGVPADGKVIGITASLTPAKDHATFLQAASIVARAVPQTRFGILGEGPLRPELEEMARQLGIEKLVTFFGNQRDVGSHISVYDIACLASFDHEGCSNATLEAMAMGKPVVVTDIGGNREIVERDKTGLMVPPKSPQAFADAILSYLEKPDWAKQMGEQGRQSVLERFSVNRMVSDYQDLYKHAIESKEQNGNKISERLVTVK